MKPSKKNTLILLQQSREVVGRLVRFLTGHAFLKRQNAVVDITCRLCEDPLADETPHHIIIDCEALCFWRVQIFGSYILDEYPEWDMKSLLRYLSLMKIILLETED